MPKSSVAIQGYTLPEGVGAFGRVGQWTAERSPAELAGIDRGDSLALPPEQQIYPIQSDRADDRQLGRVELTQAIMAEYGHAFILVATPAAVLGFDPGSDGGRPWPSLPRLLPPWRGAIAAHYVNRGKIAGKRGDPAKAKAAFRSALLLDSADGALYAALGVVLLARGEHEEAAFALEQARRFQPDHVQVHQYLTLALMRLQRYAEAEVVARRAVQLDPMDADLYGNLGTILALQGQSDDARAAYEHALILEPDLPDVRARLEELE